MIFYRKIFFFIFLFSNLFSSDNIRHIKNITSLLNSTSIESIGNQSILVATTGGIYVTDYEGNEVVDYTDHLEYANINTIASNNNNIWLGGRDGNIQILDENLDLQYVIDYIPVNTIKEIVFHSNNVFAIARYENRDVIVQYSNTDNPNYLNYFSFDNFLIDADNNGNSWFGYGDDKIINVTTIYDIMIKNDMLYIGTNEGLLQTDLSDYNNNLLLLLDWTLYDSSSESISLIDGALDYNSLGGWLGITDNNTGFNLNQIEWLETNINKEDIVHSFYIDSSDDYYILLSDKVLYCNSTSQFPDFEVMFTLPDNIYSFFKEVEIIDNNFYIALENHGIIKFHPNNIDSYEYIIPNTLFSNKITALDINSNKNIIGIGGEKNIGQGGFLISNIISNYGINNFYAEGDNYEDLNLDGFYETYKNKYPDNISFYSGVKIPYISGDKNSESVKFDNNGNFYFINNGIYLEPNIYHPYNPYNPIKDDIGYPKGLLHIDSYDFSIIDSWDSVFTGIRYVPNGYNYVSLSQIYTDNQNNLWIINPYSEGDVNKPFVINTNDGWVHIEDPSEDLYFLPEEIAFDNHNNIWIAYQKDNNEDYSPGGVRMLRLNQTVQNENYIWWPSPLSITEESSCYQYNYDLPLDDVSVWSVAIGYDQYNNTILWTLSDYGIMGYVIDYTYSGYFNSLSINIEPINCNFYFSDVAFDQFSKIRIDKQNNAWITSNTGLRMIKSNGEIGYADQSINSSLFSNIIYDIVFDDYGYIYIATDMGISILQSVFTSPQPISNISISPNPFIIGNDDYLTVSNISSSSVIQIMNLSGKVVKEFILNGQSAILSWDGIGDDGRFLNTGIYLIAAINTDNRKTGVTKFAVIRSD